MAPSPPRGKSVVATRAALVRDLETFCGALKSRQRKRSEAGDLTGYNRVGLHLAECRTLLAMASDTANPVRLLRGLFAELKREAGEARTLSMTPIAIKEREARAAKKAGPPPPWRTVPRDALDRPFAYDERAAYACGDGDIWVAMGVEPTTDEREAWAAAHTRGQIAHDVKQSGIELLAVVAYGERIRQQRKQCHAGQ